MQWLFIKLKGFRKWNNVKRHPIVCFAAKVTQCRVYLGRDCVRDSGVLCDADVCGVSLRCTQLLQNCLRDHTTCQDGRRRGPCRGGRRGVSGGSTAADNHLGGVPYSYYWSATALAVLLMDRPGVQWWRMCYWVKNVPCRVGVLVCGRAVVLHCRPPVTPCVHLFP